MKIYSILIFFLSVLFSQSIIINESMSRNISSVFDEDSTTQDWVEIYNSGTEPINLIDFYLSDDIEEWVGLFKDCGLSDVIAFQTNVSNDFPGTLVIKGK